MSQYSVGIVGCGTMGRKHAEAYEADDSTEIVAVADLDESVRTAHAEAFGVPATYETHADMLAAEDLDLVSVCTLHSTHAAITTDVADAGVEGIWCEKPMATSLGEAEDMIEAADRNGVKLTVAHQYRFNPVHEKARQLVADGAVGDPRFVTVQSSGGLLNMGTHMVDMARFFLDEPGYEWVMGQTERRTDRHERGIPIEDRCLGQVCLDDGTRLTVESDVPGPKLGNPWLQLSGTEGVLELDFNSSLTVTSGDGTAEYAPSADRSLRERYLDAFVEWLDGTREDHRCSASRAYTVTEILMAIYESSRTRGLVEAPLRTTANPLDVMIERGDLRVEHPGAYDIRLPNASVDRGE